MLQKRQISVLGQSLEGNEVPAVAITSLSGGNASPVEVGFDALDADSTAKVTLFYDTDNQGNDGVPFATNLAESDGASIYTWIPAYVQPGEYYVYAVIDDGVNAPITSYSGQTITIEPLRGDYDLNGAVTAHDFDVWRDNFGAMVRNSADGNGNGVVDAADYTVWRDSLGLSIIPVPELPGDYDRNGVVNDSDFRMWRDDYGTDVAPWSDSDGNGNGRVDAADYTVWRDNLGLSIYSPPALPGDFDRNRVVNDSDFIQWREDFGNTLIPWSGSDGNGNGVVDAADYTIWRDNMGATIDPGVGSDEANASAADTIFVPVVSMPSSGEHTQETASSLAKPVTTHLTSVTPVSFMPATETKREPPGLPRLRGALYRNGQIVHDSTHALHHQLALLKLVYTFNNHLDSEDGSLNRLDRIDDSPEHKSETTDIALADLNLDDLSDDVLCDTTRLGHRFRA
jgi:hypothetical protein